MSLVLLIPQKMLLQDLTAADPPNQPSSLLFLFNGLREGKAEARNGKTRLVAFHTFGELLHFGRLVVTLPLP